MLRSGGAGNKAEGQGERQQAAGEPGYVPGGEAGLVPAGRAWPGGGRAAPPPPLLWWGRCCARGGGRGDAGGVGSNAGATQHHTNPHRVSESGASVPLELRQLGAVPTALWGRTSPSHAPLTHPVAHAREKLRCDAAAPLQGSVAVLSVLFFFWRVRRVPQCSLPAFALGHKRRGQKMGEGPLWHPTALESRWVQQAAAQFCVL